MKAGLFVLSKIKKGVKMTVKDIFNNKIKTFGIEEDYAFSEYKKCCNINEKGIETRIKNVDDYIKILLDIKANAKKIDRVQKRKKCNLYKFCIDLHLSKCLPALKINKECNRKVKIELFVTKTIENGENDKKLKHLTKIVNKAKTLATPEEPYNVIHIDNFEFFIYTINRLLDYFKIIKQELKDNLELLIEEVHDEMTYFYLFDKEGREKHKEINQFAQNYFGDWTISTPNIIGVFEDLGGGYITATHDEIDESLFQNASVVVEAPKEYEDNFYGALRELLTPYFKKPVPFSLVPEFKETIEKNGGKILKIDDNKTAYI